MTPGTCGQCANWDLKTSPMRQYGFGRCKVDPHPQYRDARTLGPQCICRIGRFEKADPKVIARREKEVSFVL